MFQIVQGSPVHCPITDGIIGSKYRVLPMTYHVEAYAQALSGRMHHDNYEACGDDWFYVIPAGEKPLNRIGRENRIFNPVADASGDSIPF